MIRKLDFKAAILAGIVAGLVFMMLEMALVMMFKGQSQWGPPRMMAAIVMGPKVLPPPATFDMAIMMVAMMIHLMLSIVLGLMIGWAISNWRMDLLVSVVVGAVFGLLIYYVDFYLFTAMFPWFAMSRGAMTAFSHGMFGLVLGFIYRGLAKRDARAEMVAK